MIVIDHLSQELNDPYVIIIFSLFGYVVVSVFFGISGYGLNFRMKSNSCYIDNFIKTRLPKILIPFWLSNAVYIVVRFCFYQDQMTIASVVKYLLGIQLINTNAWYVISLSILYLLFWLSEKIFENNQCKAIAFTGVLSLAYFIIFLLIFRGQRYWWVNGIFAFVIGMCVSQFDSIWNRVMKSWAMVSVIILVFIVAFLGGCILPLIPMGLSLMVVASITIVCIFFCVAHKIRIQSYVLDFLGKISYELYLIHNCYRHFFKDIVPMHNDALYLLVVISASILSAYLLHKLVLQFFKIFRLI